MLSTSSNHPIQTNEQQYLLYKKYISIHAEDRDIIKYPNSSHFEIEMPEDILNILTVKLINWTFPPNYPVFSYVQNNIELTFQINNPFNLSLHGYSIPLYDVIFTALYLYQFQTYTATIDTGNYTNQQMATELARKMNYSVSQVVIAYLNNTTTPNYDPVQYPILLSEFITSGGYNGFVVAYNEVTHKIWIGNRTDGFIITNTTILEKNQLNANNCIPSAKNKLPEYIALRGLPAYIGFSESNYAADTSTDLSQCRFYYGDVVPGDNGYWLTPNPLLIGSQVYWVEAPCPSKIEIPTYLYLEIQGLNCIDETSPYSTTTFTTTTNSTNGISQSALAKIGITNSNNTSINANTNLATDSGLLPYKIFVPPAERIRRLKIRLRYHNGILVDFGGFPWSFTLEFQVLQPHQQRYMTPSLLHLYQMGTNP